MLQTVAIGVQRFTEIRENNIFYVDKTGFIKEWWESGDEVTVITRPRRFGKTLNMNMLENFFSIQYAGREDLFTGLEIWQYEEYRKLQGTWPVILISFAKIKPLSYDDAIEDISSYIVELYDRYSYVLNSNEISKVDRIYFNNILEGKLKYRLGNCLNVLSKVLNVYYGKKPIIILDEYDTPMHEAYSRGYWGEMVDFMRNLFNSSFKSNPYMNRAIMTGITRIGRESLFSDFNHANILTIFDDKYSQYFGFTENEVFKALDNYGLDEKDKVKFWYNGFTIGSRHDIYNPWSIIKYLEKKRVGLYWVNTSRNTLLSNIIKSSDIDTKQDFEKLLMGESLTAYVDECVVFDDIQDNREAIWGLMIAAGYLRAEVLSEEFDEYANNKCLFSITNYETQCMFRNLIKNWFVKQKRAYNEFVAALLKADVKLMNIYMNQITSRIISYFDSGNSPSVNEPERFYHGLVLGLLVELRDRYTVKSNRESGYGRYDIMLEPKDALNDDGIIIEFKVLDDSEEKTLHDTANNAIKQITDMNYAAELMEKGLPAERIHFYGFAFQGKNVLILGK
ncbi:MAG: AAA family ATPase [Selenomonadaceae bacterium]|nr:AAA family ATPase [Selenomonadaceae bacterium]MEE1361472.1 AAA family ATPase [Selenomonadaceae bacterium]